MSPSKKTKPPNIEASKVGFFRRFGAIFYDTLLLLAVLFLAAACLLLFNNGEAVTAKIIIIPYYLIVSFIFFGWFWTRDGQTAGLKTWKLRLKTMDGQRLTWHHALMRFLGALLSWSLLGMGFLWVLFDKNHYTLHDRLSKTYLVFEKAPDK
ncbi:MAG: RDD family protein [Methylococcales bacterium]|nr:RDD family protein [Methylococcales bacterium]MCK5924613.1 RDD family protein [Methylococcales bacterium]